MFQLMGSKRSTSLPTTWDVFLSFRGEDTRNTFTDHLYKALHHSAGFRTFKDDPELLGGEVISRALPQAIQDSKIYIVVLSKNYASSSWCLDELEVILDCYKRMERLVIPVFYNIDPSVVRKQLGSFKVAFEKHQTRFDSEKLNRWRLALNEVADFSGYHISPSRSEADIIDEVVDRVLFELIPRTLDVAKYPVGLDSRVRGITALFKSDTKGVLRIGIHGMGGVGKTTLAKAVYNLNHRRFEGSCFLANVREDSRTKGMVCLQQQLIADVLKCKNINIGNVDQGIEVIRARICSKKVLIVIDDLDDPKPIEYLEGSFASGSIVIITTRNEDLLDRIEVKSKYKVNKMNDDESLQLFTLCAFGDDKIPAIFRDLSKIVLERAGGIPLALQLFGLNLRNESEGGWEWFIEKLNQAPNNDVTDKLMISYDALKPVYHDLQDIFLDIACFYLGWKKKDAAKIMDTCYKFVDRNIHILCQRSLITINDEDELGMHDLLRDMGSRIARNNSPDEPGKHSRLWVYQDIHSVLKKQKGTDAIKGIMSLDFVNYHNLLKNSPNEEVSFAAQTFQRMSKLRFLYLNNVSLTGSFEDIFEDLRWLGWKYCPLKCLPSGFDAQKLVTLELLYSQMTTISEPNMVPPVFKKLKTLNMSGSFNLTVTPDFTRLPCLEALNLENCISLGEVHISIGSLARLVYLNLAYCSNLRRLPDSICSLRALEFLDITDCSILESLPTQLGNIRSLKVLNALGLQILTLPDSIGNLRSLEILGISNCEKVEELPNPLGIITSLRELKLKKATMLKKLPDISQLSNLEDLDLTGCRNLLSIAELPPNLIKINAKDCVSVKRLPDLSNFKQLKILNLEGCTCLTEILGLEKVTSLQEVYFTRCDSSLTKHVFQTLSGFGHNIETRRPSKRALRSDECDNWL